ncbi:MAG: choice-of-anchor Q domain-containing protein [Acidimicrobiales bacterium]
MLVPLTFLVALLPIAGRGASPSAQAATIAVIPANDFVPQRHCKDPLPSDLPHFSSTLPNALATTVNALQSGATLVIDPAPNNGEYIVTAEMAITGKTDITICGAPGTHPRIKQTSNVWRIFTIGNSSNITVEGLEIYSIYDANHDQVSGVQAIEGAHHVYIWDMWVHDVPACGVCSARSAGHNDFRYNQIWRTAGYSRYNQSGISLFNNRNGGGGDDGYGYSDYLIGNMVWASQKVAGRTTDGNCIIMDNNNGVQKVPAYTGRTLIANNLCVANGGRGIHMLQSDNIDVFHNTLYHDLRGASARGTGLDQHQGEISVYYSSNLRIVNNLSVAIPYGNVYDTGSTGTNVVLLGNIFNGPTSRQPATGFTQLPGEIPFVRAQENPATADFRPAPGSPVINAGVASSAARVLPAVDFNGKARNPNAPTVGAFEP